jgi:pimeloyl-ACP methyl ester carboxylesterase
MFRKAKDMVGRVKEKVDDQSIAFVLQTVFASCASAPVLSPAPIAAEEFAFVRRCAHLAKAAYATPKTYRFLPELGSPVFWSRTSERARIPFLVVNSNALNRIFISCRGSYCVDDFIVDATARPTAWRGGFCHAGVLETAQNIYRSLKSYVLNLSHTHGNRPITVTGHSLGAGVGAVLAELFADEFPSLRIDSLVFAPVAALTPDLAAMTTRRCRSYSTNGDFVPFLSLYSFESLPPGVLPEVIAKVIRVGIEKQLETAQLHSGATKSMPMYPPGRNFLLTFAEFGATACDLLAIDDVTMFGRLTNNLNELRHSMKVYLRWVNEFGARFGEQPLEFGGGDD